MKQLVSSLLIIAYRFLKMTAEVEFNDSVLEDGTLMEASAGLAVDVYLFDNHQLAAGSVKVQAWLEFIHFSSLCLWFIPVLDVYFEHEL